jgi:hypothetical protein
VALDVRHRATPLLRPPTGDPSMIPDRNGT